MANRTKQRAAGSKRATVTEDIDLDFSLSQQSSEADGLQEKALRETLEKCLAVEAEKKRGQKEKKFLQVAEAHLKRYLEAQAHDVRDAMKAIDEVYTSFLLDYAACEDRIQKKFSQLHDLQNNLVNLANQGQKLDEEANKASSEIYIDGLSKTRAACIGFGKIMGQLKPPGDDNWSGEE